MKSGDYFPKRLSYMATLLSLMGCALAAAPASAGTLLGQTEAIITRPGTLAKASDLDFGFVAPGTATSYLVISEASDTISVQSGNAILAGGTISRAEFVATTLPLNLVTIQLPTSATLTRVSGTETIQIDQFKHNLGPGLLGIYNVLNNGTLQFFVGARIRINPGQANGKYIGTYTVTANYL